MASVKGVTIDCFPTGSVEWSSHSESSLVKILQQDLSSTISHVEQQALQPSKGCLQDLVNNYLAPPWSWTCPPPGFSKQINNCFTVKILPNIDVEDLLEVTVDSPELTRFANTLSYLEKLLAGIHGEQKRLQKG